jgi:hypothetical protein
MLYGSCTGSDQNFETAHIENIFAVYTYALLKYYTKRVQKKKSIHFEINFFPYVLYLYGINLHVTRILL